ncbi:MAG: PEP-CTERM sorting domain-containing protein [Planctomycetota bacterium]
MQIQHLFAATLVAAVPTVASAATVSSPFLETFDDATTDVDFAFNDFSTSASGTGSQGTGPGWTIQGGQAIFYDNSNFGDVGTADVILSDAFAPERVSFSTSADFNVFAINFTNTELGVFAYAQGPTDFSENFVGLYASIDQLGDGGTGGDSEFKLGFGADGSTSTLLTSSVFDLTDGTPDFTITLSGVFLPGGDVDVTATLLQDGDAPIVLNTLFDGSLLAGSRFGVRTNPGFNTLEVGVDNLAAAVVIPEPASAAALGLIGLIGLRRRR